MGINVSVRFLNIYTYEFENFIILSYLVLRWIYGKYKSSLIVIRWYQAEIMVYPNSSVCPVFALSWPDHEYPNCTPCVH